MTGLSEDCCAYAPRAIERAMTSNARAQICYLRVSFIAAPSEFAVWIFPLIGGRDCFENIPMLNLLAVLNPVQVIEGCGLCIEKALAHDKDEVSLSQDLVDLGVLENKAGFGKDTGLGLKAGLVVFAITVVLVKVAR